MTFTAGLGDVGVVDGGGAIHLAVDVVDAVTPLQEGAMMRPIFKSARPWMLSAYCAAASGLFISYSLLRSALL